MSSVVVKSRAFGLNLEEIDIVVVDDNPGMIKILMTILSAFKVKRSRYYTSAEQALTDMISEPPHILITDWVMSPIDGMDMLQTMRNKAMHPLCNTAIIILTGEPSRKNMINALDNAATYFMVKPLSPTVLMERIKWVCNDDRDYMFNGDQMVINGQLANVTPNKRESILPEPMVLDFVDAEERGVEAKLRRAYEDVSKPPEENKEAFFLEDENEAGEANKESTNDILQNLMKDDEEIDWLDSNFGWAL